MVSIIVAVSADWGIGKDNELLWHLPDDLRRFKRLTTGKTVIMGKKTWESLPRRPLPNRINIVLTDDPQDVFEGAITAYSLEDALVKGGNTGEIFIIGGGSVYRQFLPFTDRLYITHVHKKTPADIYFPPIDPDIWEPSEREDFMSEGAEPIPCTYMVYDRKV